MSMQARLTGKLTETDGCVTINDLVVPVFPSTTEWDGTSLKWDGDEYRIGETIELGGGEPAVRPEMPSECAAFQSFIVAQRD